MNTHQPTSVLGRLRAEKGWSQMRLAQESALSLPTIQRAEQGKRKITYGSAVKLANALGVDPHDIYEGLDSPPQVFTAYAPEWAMKQHEEIMTALKRQEESLRLLARRSG